MKILVVDDEQSIRRVLDRALRKDGHEVVTAENVEDASVKLISERIDVLLHRPRGENGRELIGKADIRGEKPKVIVSSAFINAELEEELRLDELNYFVQICLEKDPPFKHRK